ncbi:MAG: site-specific tyrosine recombinase/integron integrase, partial [Promethearchaeota archaeon]
IFSSLPASIKDIIEDFLVTKKIEEGRSDNTIKAYKHDLSIFFEFMLSYCRVTHYSLESLNSIKTIHVRRFLMYLDDRNYSKQGIARKIATLKSFFNHAIFMSYISTNPTERIRSPKISKSEYLPKFLTHEEIQKILEHAKKHLWIQDYILLRLLYATMCRVSEVCNIKIKDIDFNRGIILVKGKGNKERWVPLDDNTLELIKKVIIPVRSNLNDPLFINSRGRAIQPRVIQTMFQKIKKDLKFPEEKRITPHVFRHTGATMLRRNGMDISELQDLLGHASPNTTRIYARNDIESLHESFKQKHPLNIE